MTLLSWTGRCVCRVGGYGRGAGQLDWPVGLRLLADGSGFVVADSNNNRLCVFSTTGVFVRSVDTQVAPGSVVECDGGASFLFTCTSGDVVCKVGAGGSSGSGGGGGISGGGSGGGGVASFGCKGSGVGQFSSPTALALARSGSELLVLELNNPRFQVLRLWRAV